MLNGQKSRTPFLFSLWNHYAALPIRAIPCRNDVLVQHPPNLARSCNAGCLNRFPLAPHLW